MSVSSSDSRDTYENDDDGVTDEESQDNDSYQHPGNSKKINKCIIRKASDASFKYVCEWNNCRENACSMNEFNHHISTHLHSFKLQLKQINSSQSGTLHFKCPWQDCNATVEGQAEDFSRHVFYHTFHQYLKFLGQHIQKVEGLNLCLLDTTSRNVIPELPEKLMCRWYDCGLVYDNPYIFYSHVSHHCEDYNKGSKSRFKCKWEGCDTTTRLWYKMKDHIRSHTQAKVVACPTCGSLFANNTRFIDHLLRQCPEEEQKFECSHCSSRFASERLLRDHMRHHVNHYKCPLCNMTCHSPSAVRNHVRYRHSDERSFQCSQCDHRAKTETDLARHSVTHLEKSMYSCTHDDCDQVFDTQAELRSHRTSHGPIKKQYECHICSKHFLRGTHLTTHLMEQHSYKWPSGHKKFRYKQHDDGYRRLETIRYESIEVSQQVLSQDMPSQQQSKSSENAAAPKTFTINGRESGTNVGTDLGKLNIATGTSTTEVHGTDESQAKSTEGTAGSLSSSKKNISRKSQSTKRRSDSEILNPVSKRRKKNLGVFMAVEMELMQEVDLSAVPSSSSNGPGSTAVQTNVSVISNSSIDQSGEGQDNQPTSTEGSDLPLSADPIADQKSVCSGTEPAWPSQILQAPQPDWVPGSTINSSKLSRAICNPAQSGSSDNQLPHSPGRILSMPSAQEMVSELYNLEMLGEVALNFQGSSPIKESNKQKESNKKVGK